MWFLWEWRDVCFGGLKDDAVIFRLIVSWRAVRKVDGNVGNMAQNEVIDDDEYYSEYLNGWITVIWQMTTSTYVIIE